MTEQRAEKTVGVIGGLGPEATLDFFAKVLQRTEAKTDQDHIRVIIDNNPKVPNRNDAIAGLGPASGPALARTAQALERAGADFLVMVCNTAHAFQDDIAKAVRIPFISLIDEVCAELGRRLPQARRIGLLAAQGCLDARLYQTALRQRGLEPVILDDHEQARFMQLLYRIKAGDRSADLRAEMRHLGGRLAKLGAEAVIAACTEVPLVLAENDLTCPVLDSTGILAGRCVLYAKGLAPLPARTAAEQEPVS
jgi:aspartate racemase